MNKEGLVKMDEVEMFLNRIVSPEEQSELHFDENSVGVMYGYAEALLSWEKDNFNSWSFFSTDNELFLKYREKIQEQFKLPIFTREEGEKHEEELHRRDVAVYRNKVSFWN